MNFLPKIKKCPCCNSINLFRVNGTSYKNNFKSLLDWTLKKKINCQKCKVAFGLFIDNKNNKIEKVIWMELLECEDVCLDALNKLQISKVKYKEKNKEREYKNTLQQIQDIQNKIRLDQSKVKIKVKMQNLHLSTGQN